MSDSMYDIMGSSNLSWNCFKCGLPNFSSAFFDYSDNLSIFNNTNSFSMLSCDSPGAPAATSSPRPTHNRSKNSNPPQPKKSKSLKIISLNFQSIKNKKPELDLIIDSINPDIIIGTETWLDPTISSSEYFSPTTYTVYRKDRQPNKKGQSHGGVLVAVKNEFQSCEAKELETDCELVWVEINIPNSRKILVSSFYRPQPHDKTSLENLNISLSRINPSSKSIVILSGDFNLGHIDWNTSTINQGKPNITQHQELLDIIADHSLIQLVKTPTRQDKTLDLFLTNYPSIIDNLETKPP